MKEEITAAAVRCQLQAMHRRAQKAEGESMKMKAAYERALWYAEREPRHFSYMLAHMLKHMSPFRQMKSAPPSYVAPVDKSNSGDK